jgi:hypothetical protein
VVKVLVFNSFHNHDSLFYPIKNQKSIPGITLKRAKLPGFNQELNLLSLIFLLYNMRKFMNIIIFLLIYFRYNSISFLSSNKKSQKKYSSMFYRVDSCRFYLFSFLNCDKCVNTGEPAAVLVFLIRIKVVEESRPESAAVGSLFCFLPQTYTRHTQTGSGEGYKDRNGIG